MWCGDTRMARRVLDDKGFPYEWVDVDGDAGALAYVKEVSNGMSSIPVLVFEDGDVLVEPSESALTGKLETCQGGPHSHLAAGSPPEILLPL